MRFFLIDFSGKKLKTVVIDLFIASVKKSVIFGFVVSTLSWFRDFAEYQYDR